MLAPYFSLYCGCNRIFTPLRHLPHACATLPPREHVSRWSRIACRTRTTLRRHSTRYVCQRLHSYPAFYNSTEQDRSSIVCNSYFTGRRCSACAAVRCKRLLFGSLWTTLSAGHFVTTRWFWRAAYYAPPLHAADAFWSAGCPLCSICLRDIGNVPTRACNNLWRIIAAYLWVNDRPRANHT